LIERNLGNAERLIRLAGGLLFLLWSLNQPALRFTEYVVMIVATALILNGVFSRCYLWYVLDINSCERGDGDCNTPPGCY